MKLSTFLLITLLLLVQAVGCKRWADVGSNSVPVPSPSQSETSESDVRAAIHAHLASIGNLNLQAFDTNVQDVSIQGDKAQANVTFQLKGGPGVMQMIYRLERRGGTWAVIDSNPVGSDFSHPVVNQGQNPGTGVAPGGSHSLADTLKSFKDATPEPQSNAPPLHPPVSSDGSSVPR